MLVRNPDKRLGRTGGFHEIKSHSFFEGIDFDAILQKKVEASFKPDVSGRLDVHNFDEMFTTEEIQMTKLSDNALNMIKKNQNLFKDFTN